MRKKAGDITIQVRTVLYTGYLFFCLSYYNLDSFMSELGILPVFTRVRQGLLVVSIFVFLFRQIASNNLKNRKPVFLVTAYIAYLLACQFIVGESPANVLRSYYPLLSMVCFIAMESDEHFNELSEAFSALSYIVVFINFITILFSDRSDMYATKYFFLGGRNQMGPTFCIGLSFIRLRRHMQGRERRITIGELAYVLLIVASSVLSRSGTTLLCVFVMILITYFLNNGKKENQLLVRAYPFGYAVVWVGVVIFHVQDYFRNLLQNVFHRNVTLTGRTYLWESALRGIRQKPIFGHGVLDNMNIFFLNGSFYSTHNQVLQILYEGGVVGLLLFILTILLSCELRNPFKKYSRFFLNALLAVMVMLLTEASGEYAVFILAALCYYARRFEAAEKGKEVVRS